MKGAAHVFCSSLPPINFQTIDLGTTLNNFAAQDRRFNAFGSGHPGGACFVYADGSAQFISDSVDPATFTSLSTRDGGETNNSTN
jgi:hypothetical protein